MAMNKFIHPRNIYRNPPDFAKLANKYSEFANIAKMDVSGKVSIDFKNPKSLRILTKYLLKSDFNLDIEIPEGRLVPTLPLRLNYILWIEDVLNSIDTNQNVLGIDIGTGACAIYPLLAAVKNNWHMIGTETDLESYNMAQKNIVNNDLQNLIKLKYNETSTAIEHLLKLQDDVVYNFCMCNPPFYSNVQELCESRNTARPQPKNAFTGSPQELITEGGELEFIRKLISESKAFKDKIIIYSTMIGHKYNLKELLQDLKAEGINHTSTEFCQGRVTRWGLAWTYQNHNLNALVPSRNKPRKKISLVRYNLPLLEDTNDIEFMFNKLKALLHNLKITYKIQNRRGSNHVINILAKENTWSYQRRKRRQLQRFEAELKKRKINDGDAESINSCEKVSEDVKIVDNLKKDGLGTSECSTSSSSYVDNNNMNEDKDPIVHATVNLFKSSGQFVIEMDFLNGSGGKQVLHQIGQYIKNNWK